MPLRGALALYCGAKLIRWGARLVGYGLHLEHAADLERLAERARRR